MDTLEIDKLQAGPELDRLIAEKVMGWEVKGSEFIDERGCFRTYKSTFEQYEPSKRWEPSINFIDTMEVIDKIKEDRDLFIEWWNDGEWFIAAHPLGVDREPTARCDEFDTDTGEPSLPLAVCRYALKLMVQEEEAWKRYPPEEGESN